MVHEGVRATARGVHAIVDADAARPTIQCMPDVRAADGSAQGHAAHGTWRFRDDIQGVRALAILLVVAYHAVPGWLPGGYIGVDVFFVVSGFLITGIVIAEVERTGRLSLLNFWARRARRLIPAALVMVSVTLAMATVLSSPFALALHARTATLAALYGSNVLYRTTNADYFAINSQPNLLLHTWSLSVEEQFYLCAAPLLALVAWGSMKRKLRFRDALTVVLVLLTVASFAASLSVAASNRVAAFYLLPTRFWELAVGALLTAQGDALAGVVSRLRATRAGWTLTAAACVALAAIIWVARTAGERTPHPGWITTVPVLATACVLLVGMGASRGMVTRWLGAAPLGAIGRLSYSWYLWHWPLLVLLGEAMGYPTAAQRVATAVFSFGVAWLSYRWVEAPVHESARLAGWPRLSIAAALGASALVAVAGRKVWGHAGRAEQSPQLAVARASSARPPLDCMGQLGDVDEGSLCTFGPPDAARTVVIFGDSHMAQWFPALEPLARREHFRLVALVKSGCPAPMVHVEANRSHLPFVACDRWRDRALDVARTLRPDVVLVSSWHQYGVIVDGATRLTTLDDTALDAWGAGIDSTLRRLAQGGSSVVLLRDTPMPGIVVRDCLTTQVASATRCSPPRRLAVDTLVASREREVAARIPGVQVADFTNDICGAERCPAVRDSVIVYRDAHHLSNAFTRTMEAQLDSLLAEAWPRP